MSELPTALLFQSYGPYILAGVLVCGALLLWRHRRELRGRDASRGDPVSTEIEERRTAARIAGTMQYASGPVVLVLALVAGADLGTAFLIAAVIGAGFVFRSKILRDRYNREFKENFVRAELAGAFDNLNYRPDAPLDDRHIREARFFTSQDRLRGDDFIEADYRGRHFAQCDLVVKERIANVKKRSTQESWRDVFRGRMVRFDLAEPFPGPVKIVKWDFDAAGAAPSGDWRAVETELHAFNQSFKVLARDPAAAMAVLKPQMLEGIFRLDRLLRRPLGMLFAERSIYVFFPSGRDAFDVAAGAGKTLREERELVREDIRTIAGFLDAMEYGMRDNRGLMDNLRPAAEPAADASAPVPAPPAATEIPEDAGTGIGGYALKRNLLWLWRTPTLFVLAGYFASAVYLFLEFPERFGVGVRVVNDDVTLTQFVPTIAYLLVMSLFVSVAALSVGRGSLKGNLTRLAVLAILLIIHGVFLGYNIAAR